jgi:hypothetical protein
MDDYLKVEGKNGSLDIEAVKEITAEDFAPVAVEDGEGCAISFIAVLCDDTPWVLKKGDIKHVATLKIAFCYAPQLKAKVEELQAAGIKPPQLAQVYLWDLWKTHLCQIEVVVKSGKDKEKAKEKAFQELKSKTEIMEKDFYRRAAAEFNKALAMLKEI